jgi:hypothetical protein
MEASMFRLIATIALVAGFTAAADNTELRGVLIDRNCSYNVKPRIVPGPRIEGGMLSAYVHQRDCALKPESQESGYGIFTYDQEFVPFDNEGNRKALAFLRATKREDDLRVLVRGQIQDGVFILKELKLMD